MTIVRGVWCSKCRIRYAYHACKNGMPCEHHMAEIARDGIGIIAPATLIFCESWRGMDGYRRFELQELYYIYDKETGKFIKKWNGHKHFEATNIGEEELKEKFLNFLKEKLPVHEWMPFVGAFVSLYSGGKSLTCPPTWRLRQLARKYARQMERKDTGFAEKGGVS